MIAKCASTNLIINETIWAHREYSHMLDGLKRIEGKLNIAKGACNTKSLTLRENAHECKVYSNKSFVQEGLREVKMLMDKIKPLVIDCNDFNTSTTYYLFYF